MTRMTPPNSSARNFLASPHPHRMPKSNPAMDRMNETMPIMPTAGRMSSAPFMPTKANDTPTANASMLVAMANASTTFRRVGSKVWRHSSSLSDSAGCCPSYKWHECLEKTEKECHGKHGAPTWAFQYDAAGNGHGEAIHGKSHSQEADF